MIELKQVNKALEGIDSFLGEASRKTNDVVRDFVGQQLQKAIDNLDRLRGVLGGSQVNFRVHDIDTALRRIDAVKTISPITEDEYLRDLAHRSFKETVEVLSAIRKILAERELELTLSDLND